MFKKELKPFLVATNTDVTATCLAFDKDDAVRRCREAYIREYGEDDQSWEAYDFYEYYRKEDWDGDDDGWSVSLFSSLW